MMCKLSSLPSMMTFWSLSSDLLWNNGEKHNLVTTWTEHLSLPFVFSMAKKPNQTDLAKVCEPVQCLLPLIVKLDHKSFDWECYDPQIEKRKKRIFLLNIMKEQEIGVYTLLRISPLTKSLLEIPYQLDMWPNYSANLLTYKLVL